MIFEGFSFSQFVYGKSLPHHKFWFQDVKKLYCDNTANACPSLRIFYYCTPTAEYCVLFLLKPILHFHYRCNIPLENSGNFLSF